MNQSFKKYNEQEIIGAFEAADLISDGAYLANHQGVVLKVNKGYTQITGIQENEILGKKMQEILDQRYSNKDYIMLSFDAKDGLDLSSDLFEEREDRFSKPMAICQMVLKKKEEQAMMGTITTEKIQKKVLFIGRPYTDNGRDVTHVLTIMREVSELFKMKERLENLELKSKRYVDELLYLRQTQVESELIGDSAEIYKIRQCIDHIAKTDTTVLITGETGVGKEIVAKEIYKKSTRGDKPFIKVNCAAIPESLVESELFGYEKGAFTGALHKEKLGYFELANNGTLLLDEIGEMPVHVQSKLLRVLQEREIIRIGGNKSIRLNIRIIAATNQNLEAQIKQGRFREDLFYRLNVIPIQVPALRERRGDIALLANKFALDFMKKHDKFKVIEAGGMRVLESYDWPGNVRELENVMERLIIIGDQKGITKEDVTSLLGLGNNQGDRMTLKEAVNELEKEIIERALKKYKSSHKAAKVLGITQTTVLRKAKSLGINKW